jgi:hypothetical protein
MAIGDSKASKASSITARSAGITDMLAILTRIEKAQAIPNAEVISAVFVPTPYIGLTNASIQIRTEQLKRPSKELTQALRELRWPNPIACIHISPELLSEKEAAAPECLLQAKLSSHFKWR